MERLRIDVWSDIACPWCYVGKRRLEAALASFERREQVDVVWRAFELDPSSPAELGGGVQYAERLARKYGCSVARAQDMIERMVAIGRSEGLSFDFERIRPGNTRDAHRLLHLAAERGVQDVMKERLLRGYLVEGEAVGSPSVLTRLGVEAGLDAEHVTATLASDAFAREVRRDEAEAAEIGITGVPFFVFGERYAVSGAQPPELLSAALSRAWSDLDPSSAAPADGAVCAPDGC